VGEVIAASLAITPPPSQDFSQDCIIDLSIIENYAMISSIKDYQIFQITKKVDL